MAFLHAIQAGPAKTRPKKDQVGGLGGDKPLKS